MDSKEKLTALRQAMQKAGVSGYLQSVHDEYLNEYPPVSAQRVAWLSGFTGSAGTVVVMEKHAALFTDGRYTLQAENQTDAALFERHNISDTLPEAWIAMHAKPGERIGYDARLYTRTMLRRMEQVLTPKDIELVPMDNLVDFIWQDRPAVPASALFVHELQYSGMESAEKRRQVAKKLAENNAYAVLLTSPDSVDWLFNIRAADVEHTPLALGAAIVEADGHARLFIHPSRCDDTVRAHLGNEVSLVEPTQLKSALAALGANKRRILADTSTLPVWYMQAMEGADIIATPDPCTMMKAMKNTVELQGIRNAHIRDGVAVVKFLAWLDRETATRSVTEMETCNQLQAMRAQHAMFRDLSFPTISGSGPNGAIVHYRVTEESNRALKKGELFLLDSGAQYPDGTTDITRTLPVGEPSAEHKDRFTRVLKGHIAIATAKFPKGTTGSQLDTLARQYLWQAGLDYDHGTGHGVGCFLGVHEGPQRISKRGGDVPLEVGMILSNEPGYYKTGAYGIRIENLVTVVEAKPGEGKPYLEFGTLTCVPIDTRLVSVAMLTESEKTWLNDYHAWVLSELKGDLDAQDAEWLTRRCLSV